MMLPSFYADLLHLTADFLESLENVKELFSCDHKQLASHISHSSAISDVSRVCHEDVRVTEVGAFHIEVEGDKDWLPIMQVINVHMKLNSAFEDEEHFLCVVLFAIKLILCIDFHRFQQG